MTLDVVEPFEMPLLRINAQGKRPTIAGDSRRPEAALIQGLIGPGPVIILIHGFKFSPFGTAHNPHDHILSLVPDPNRPKAFSWPRALGFSGDTYGEGLCIAFGWEARGSIWKAAQNTRNSGAVLAELIKMIHRIDPTRPIHVVAHSLGCQVLFRALPKIQNTPISRAILIAAAGFRNEAHKALAQGGGTNFINVTSRENRLYDWLFRAVIPSASLPLGCGLGSDHPNWLDLPIDGDAALSFLRHLRFPIAAPAHRVCHWSGYLRPGVWSLYKALLRNQTPALFYALKEGLRDVSDPECKDLTGPKSPALPFWINPAS